MIKADAIVDHVFGKTWQVTVWEHGDRDNEKSYRIVAMTDTLAAQDGIRRFCAEAEGLQHGDDTGAISEH